MFSNASRRYFASALSIDGFGTLKVRNKSNPKIFSLKKEEYLVRSFFIT